MSIGFGPGLARLLSSLEEPVDDDDTLVAACVRFAEQGFTRRFVEVVGNRVAAFAWSPEAGVAVSWLDDDAATAVRNAAERMGGTTRYDWVDDEWCMVLVPGFTRSIAEGDCAPDVTSGPLEGKQVGPLLHVIEELRSGHAELDAMTAEERDEEIEPERLEYEKEMLETFELAEKLGLVFSFGS